MNMKRFGYLLFFFLFSLTVPVQAADLFQNGGVVEVIGPGEVNWTSRMIRARGSGAPNLDSQNIAVVRLGAERAAKMDAMRNILEVIKGIRISSETTFGDQMLKSDLIHAKVEGLVKGAKVVDTKYFSDGAVDIVVEMPLFGPLVNLALPPTGEHQFISGSREIASGLIIDARGTSFMMALAPQVFDEAGKEVYGPSKVDNQVALREGVVSYYRDQDEARKSGQVGEKPIVVKAVKVNPPNSSNLVVSKGDANRLREPGVDLTFLRNGKVAILVD